MARKQRFDVRLPTGTTIRVRASSAEAVARQIDVMVTNVKPCLSDRHSGRLETAPRTQRSA